MHKYVIIFSACLVLLCTACQKSTSLHKGFFDSLIIDQASKLAIAHAHLTKTARIDAKESTFTSVPTRSTWDTELEVFKLLDIYKKPAYRDAYHVQDSVKDPNSNLLIRSYSANSDVPLTELRFFYFHNFKNLRRIEAVSKEKNPLYATVRRMSMEFDEINGTTFLSAFSVEGNQKMMLNDSVYFLIKSGVNF